ncbi:hypothetical protein J2Y45_003843 [Dyadobacter sp. BE34]|uniref:DUF2306 domain-containing protein n=1 Tax=Dyadobacter fermentans TaxID=94254 RepID=A0ABU1QZR9_9BACT|nr:MULTISPECIES: DUF2306 domain-containing protein [Dyadobacter]MDR6806651.1 hypothetical protein [Dyadobacter fermentans]MDR7044393.1 hypothetical protein [Dyadobacter sp. BE242]MDR7198703.1 hypothetical protein [Dyadobacter sp. BE34]MDR7216665.1 hypothetical protein [Dyadobacter sp. BE31]MDR7263809.1 hypothetical protein [Dyadobacter sp. BE32]
MTEPVSIPSIHVHYRARKLLNMAVTTWFVVTIIGQWTFGGYIIAFYGKSTASGDLAKWNEVLPHGYVKGDWAGNLVVGVHVLLAAVLVLGGPLQLLPFVRRSAPLFHRWLGRLYVVTAIIVATGGLVMVWTRGAVGDRVQHVSISIQTIYIVLFAWLAWRCARTGRFDQHRKWGLRLFMVVSGVWFFRIGLMCWLVLNGGPAGFDPRTFSGPFLTALAVLVYALPVSLGMLELYFYVQKTRKHGAITAVALLILIVTALMAVGIFGAIAGMWLPRIG